MKKLISLLLICLLIFSCTKDADDVIEGSDKTDSLLYSLSSGGEGGGGSSTNGGVPSGQIEAGQITAGEWNDIENWDFWNNLFNEEPYAGMDSYWFYDLAGRISVKITDQAAVPVVGVKVELLNDKNEVIWVSCTDNLGTAVLWPKLNTEVSYVKDEAKIRFEDQVINNILEYAEGINEIVKNSSVVENNKELEIAFMVDATGSMSDELEYLKVELIDVIEKVRTGNPNTTISMGSVFYRDEGDNYLTKYSQFCNNVNETIDFIKEQSANGGGDFPEAVHTALNVAINDLNWSERVYSRLLFILLDAPPHYDRQIIDQIHSLIQKASLKGIKLIPITASGINKETEFLMRYFAISTNGTYVFITNDSGIGNDHLEPSVGEYEVENLNDLMVRIISENLE